MFHLKPQLGAALIIGNDSHCAFPVETSPGDVDRPATNN